MNEKNSDIETTVFQFDDYQKNLEKALAQLGMRYWEYDIQSKQLYRSALIQNEVGYSAYKENVPESYVEEGIIHPAYAGAYLDFYHNLAKGIGGRLVFQSKFADGHWGWLDISYTIHCDQNGTPVKAVGIGGNISRYSSITIFQLQKNQYKILYANEVFFQMYGCDEEPYRRNLVGYLDASLDTSTKASAKELFQQAVRTGKMQTMEYSYCRPDGIVLWLSRRFLVVPQPEKDSFLIPAITEDITERHTAEIKLEEQQKHNLMLLEESRKQQEEIINNLPTGVIVFKIVDGIYHIVQVNPAICRMMQMNPKKAVGTNGEAILQLTHPDDLQIVIEAARKLAVPGTEVQYEFRSLNRKTGLYRWTAADGKSVMQTDEKILVYISYQDITERREKEEEYKRRIELLAELDDENLIAKGRHNLTQNQVIAYSPKAFSAAHVRANRSYDEAVEALAQMAMTPEQSKEIRQETSRKKLIEKYHKGETEGNIEFRRNLLHQSPRWTVVKYSLFEEPESHDVIAFMYSYDITDRVRENRIIIKIGSMEYDLMGLIDVHTRRYTMINQFVASPSEALSNNGDFDLAVRRRLEYEKKDGENEGLIRQFLVAEVIEQLKEKAIYSILYSISATENSMRRKRFQFSYLDDTKETIMFFRSDITEMYEKEQEQLRKIESALETANNANAAKTEFFSRMSHDMRTPMNGILGLAALSREENNPVVLKENIEKIYESGEYLLGLINDTLDFQRIESGKLKLEPQIVSTLEIVNNIIDMVRQTADTKGVKLVVKNSNADLGWHVRVDPMRLKQIFLNLLSNAVKFTPKGGTVELCFQLLSRENMISHDLIMVRDTGIGMSQEFLESGIFKPFSQESNAVTSQYAGSGLGLSIAKSLVELMGGHIEVESELGAGTTFFVYLDFERVDKEEANSVKETSLAHSESIREHLIGKKILLVEDHPLNAEIAKRLLRKAECQVDWLQNGAEAVKVFQEGPDWKYDLVLMDIRMPVMDGLEAAKRIRAIDSDYAKTVPIIAMTANAYEEDIRHSLEAGMNAHLSKPIERDIFFATIQKYLLHRESDEK